MVLWHTECHSSVLVHEEDTVSHISPDTQHNTLEQSATEQTVTEKKGHTQLEVFIHKSSQQIHTFRQLVKNDV